MGVVEELALIFSLKFMGDLHQIEDVSYVSECPLYCSLILYRGEVQVYEVSCCVLRFYLGSLSFDYINHTQK